MASAGRILIMPKGDWDAEAEYEMLDLVFHNDTAWLSKKSVVGVEPSNANSEYWFKFAVVNTQDYLSTAGGKVRGMLGVGGGKGIINGNDYGAILQSFIDDNNYRSVRVENPLQASNSEDWLKLIDCSDGTISQYKVFGEHNLEMLKAFIEQVIAEYLAKN